MSTLAWLEWPLLLAGLAVMHLVWQGLLCAAVLAAWRARVARYDPRTRHGVAMGLLVGLPVIALITAGATTPARDHPLVSGVSATGLMGQPSLGAQGATWLGAAWACAAFSGLVGLAHDAWRARRLARCAVDAGPRLRGEVARCARALGLPSPRAVRVTDQLAGPALVGRRGGTLLLPPSLAAGADAAERDALLAHELAHLARRDLVAHTVQRGVRALLGAHPAVRWISGVVDEEREACCDDLVLARGVDRRIYVRALARLALETSPAPAAVLGAHAGNVAGRLRRLLTGAPPIARSRGGARVLPALAGTWLATALGMAWLVPGTVQVARCAPAWEARVLAETGGTYEVRARDPAGTFTLAVEAGRAVAATLDGVPVDPDDILQRGARVSLPDAAVDRRFQVRLLAGCRIEWHARQPPPDAH